MSSGTGWRMISLKNFSPNSILLSHSEGTLGLRSFHQNSCLSATNELTPRKAPRFLVNHRHGATKQPLHLIAETGMHSAAVAVNIQGPHELGERTTQDQLAASSPHGFGTDPG